MIVCLWYSIFISEEVLRNEFQYTQLKKNHRSTAVCSMFKDDGGRDDVGCIKKLPVCHGCRMTFFVVECRTCGEGRCTVLSDTVSGEGLVLQHSYLIVFVETTRSKLWIRSLTDRPNTFLHPKHNVKGHNGGKCKRGTDKAEALIFWRSLLRFNMKRVKYGKIADTSSILVEDSDAMSGDCRRSKFKKKI